MTYEPYGYGYGYDPYQDPYQGGWGGNEDWAPEEDTESQKLRKEQEKLEAIESNRLYLRKVQRRCVQEEFADLEKTQMFLFEFLIELMEVNAKSELGLVPESEEGGELVAKVQFLDTPPLEIREKGERIESSDSVDGQTEYFQTVGNAGLQDALDTSKDLGQREQQDTKSNTSDTNKEETAVEYDTKWENSSGKSLLFSKTTLEIIEGLDRLPIKVQISRCVESTEEEGESSCEPLGYALLRLPEHFNLSVLQSCKSGVILPVSCVHRDTCQIRNVFGVKKGEMQVFVRLSCFGSVITTSFQSVGPERRYVFKPSPLPEFKEGDESDFKRDAVLKPIVAEEEVAVGITILKDPNIFQKPVLWRNNAQSCGCLEQPPEPITITEHSLRMPRPSNTSLCRDAGLGKQSDKPLCDWHNLVSKEIKNNPGGNCGCLNESRIIENPQQTMKTPLVKPPTIKMPSRIGKMKLKETQYFEMQKVPEKEVAPIKGLWIQPEPTDCNCNCPQIRNSLSLNPMMKYNWQIK